MLKGSQQTACACIGIHCVWDGSGALLRWVTAPGDVCACDASCLACLACLIILKNMLSLGVPEHHYFKRGVRSDQSQQGIDRGAGVCARRRGSGGICRVCAAAMRGHVGIEMITAATMSVKSQTGRICSLNLITGTQTGKQALTGRVYAGRPQLMWSNCGGETVGNNWNNPTFFLSSISKWRQ